MIEDMGEEFESLFFTFKLVSGDTIICQVLQDTDKNIIIRDPFQIKTHTISNDKGVRSLTYYAEWFASADSRVHMIRKDHILSACIPDKALKHEYHKLVVDKTINLSDDDIDDVNSDFPDLNFKIDLKDRFGLN